ncbi:MAG: calcium-binding protein [Pseudomonadota bacterium]
MSNDTLIGGAGNDTIFGGIGDDLVLGGLGADFMDGGSGTDRLSYADATSRVVVDMLNGTVRGAYAAGDIFFNFEHLEGGQVGDLLLGDNDDNVLFGGDGNDELQGRFGDDTLIGGAGADTLSGGGNTGTASYENSPVAVSINLFSGVATGGHAAGDVFVAIDNLIGSAGNDTLTGFFADNVLEGGAGADVLNGGAGIDTASYESDTAGVQVSLDANSGSGGHATGDSFAQIENLRGGSGNDALTGDGAANEIWGGSGSDTLTGLGSDDTLEGGAGGDLLQGGAGFDWASYSEADSAVTVNLLTDAVSGTDAVGDVFDSIENLRGTAFADNLTGDLGENTIEGGAGADTLDGGLGIDTVSYANSNTRVVVDLFNGNALLGHADGDVISGFENLTGSRLPDYLLGSNGANVIEGGRGRDRLESRGGDDTLIGGEQDDNLKGGAGADTFVFRPGDAYDIIADWEDGLDLLDFSAFPLTFGDVQAASTQLPAGALLIDFGSGDSVQINDFAFADFDAGDVIV